MRDSDETALLPVRFVPTLSASVRGMVVLSWRGSIRSPQVVVGKNWLLSAFFSGLCGRTIGCRFSPPRGVRSIALSPQRMKFARACQPIARPFGPILFGEPSVRCLQHRIVTSPGDKLITSVFYRICQSKLKVEERCVGC
jgi:hypothetical protein